MIDLETHKKLMAKWPGRIYATPERVGPRLRHLEGLLPMLKDKVVLELGANAGIHALEICQWADHYIGIEPDADYREQFMHTFFDHERFDEMWGLWTTLKEYDHALHHQPDALVACVMFYLLSDEELELLAKHIMPRVDTVIIQERVAHRERKGNTTNGLHTPKAIRKWLKRQGFSAATYFDKTGKIFEVVGHK